ncbi:MULTISPECIES: hypothetical protein [Frigoribacterium]|jgi:hypothetical protein|uniref:hypothetical protein n=1 Tax=Frigoribacterium TaxID=96492 RepID=UPI0006F2D8EE|nr:MULTISPECIES: hypothetical protein [Frigoribacterium]KQR46293.1 hypothetical protein ASF82_01860 [Frigoribacterium sp. Leaf164]MBD8658708.1 hypothetical protein [Frigoribacterium sp. CFBP 8754]MBD8728422.1 hypothetical protein [Frigoribacterium sp. CFBP 13707]NII49889.1 hypothetical protein [Frigoribacterium endophyticum]
MSDEKMTRPIMDGADEATDAEKTRGLAEQVEHDHAGEGDAAKDDVLRERQGETGTDPQAAADEEAGEEALDDEQAAPTMPS